MNHDENNPDLQTFIEPELEARLVASVLGEASAFETAELDRLATEKPELAIFKRRIEAVHGLVGAAVRPDQAPLRLAPERRAKILQTIGAAPARVPSGNTNVPVLLQLAEARRKRRKKWIWASSLAASFMFASILALRTGSVSDRAVVENARQLESKADQYLVETDRSAKPYEAIRSNENEAVLKGAEETFRLEAFSVAPSLTTKLRKALTSPASPAESSSMQFGRDDAPQAAAAPSVMARIDGEGQSFKAAALGGELSDERRAQLRAAIESKDQAKAKAGAGGRGIVQSVIQERTSANKSVVAASPFAEPSQRISNGYINTAPGTAGKKESLLAPDQTAVAPKDQVMADEIVVMSPHTVEASSDRGYIASATMSGSRMRTELSDIGSSTSVTSADSYGATSRRRRPVRVATKQKLVDASSMDVNDNFLFGEKRDTDGVRRLSEDKEADVAQSAAAVDTRLSEQKAAEAAATPAPPPADAPRGEISAAKEAVSTFSLHVSDVSFRLAQAALARGEMPDPARIRPEEFYNAFDYGDPSPTAAEKISSRIEQAAHPLLQQRNLVRIAVKVGATGRGASQPLHLTVLLDTSGSMEREDRIASVRRALDVLASLLGANDRVTLIGFSRQPRLLAEQLPGNQAARLSALAEGTPYTGGTNLEEALKLAGQLARRHQNLAAQNRIVLITDGAANLGNADPAQLATMIEALRQQGIAFDACGVGTDGLDDSILEALTRKGDGRYYILDSAADADAGFARQLAGAFRPAAENVKVQVRFNPARVGSYRLIGFEQHRLREEDFRNDKVDAAELAAEEAAVALYQVEVLPQGEGELGEVFVRFRDAALNDMVERSWTIRHEPQTKAFDRSTPSMQLAGTAALLAEKLRGGDSANLIELAELAPIVNSLRGHYASDARVQELLAMFEQMRRRNGK